MALTDKQKRFCQEYLIDQNGTQAAIRSGYSRRSASTLASKLMNNTEVMETIDNIKLEMTKSSSLEAEWVLSKLKEIADDPEAHPTNRIRALELLGKHLGMFREQNENQTQIAIVINGAAAEISEYAR